LGNILEDEKRIFIKNYLEKAQTALDDAELNIEHNRLFTASNRIYYSIFYSVISLSYLENFITSKHSQLMGWFNKKFIYEEKIFDETLMRIYKEAYENRMESDYEISTTLTVEDISANFEKAKSFVKTLSDYISQKISEDK
jgi:uncharacterized protein (UPF0332 family)